MPKFYLEGGGVVKNNELVQIDKRALKEAGAKKIFVMDFTTEDDEKLAEYRQFLSSYFKKLGAKKVKFASEIDLKKQVDKKLEQAGLVYLPGGDTEMLLKKIRKNNIDEILLSLDTVFVGNSAGALAMCKETILTSDKDTPEAKILPGLNMVPISVDVHYTESHDAELIEWSKDRDIYAIPEQCSIIYNDGLDFLGDIWKFSNGKKKKIN